MMPNDTTNITDSAATAKTQQSTKGQKTKYKKKVYKHPPKKTSSKNPGETNMLLPPADANQFSSNWKMLLKTLTPAPVKSQGQSDAKKKTPEVKTVVNSKQGETHKKQANNLTTNNDKPSLVKSKKARKDKSVPSGSQVNWSGKDQTQQKDKAMKRKPDHAKAMNSSEHKAKKKKKTAEVGEKKATKVDVVDSSEKKTKKKTAEVPEKKTTEADLWFDDVDPDDLEATVGAEAADVMRKRQGVHTSAENTESALVKDRAFDGVTRWVAMDCEMVGVGQDGEDSIVARVSLVNRFGKCIYDKYVKPTETVTDYRTAVSGIRPDDIKNGENVKTVQREVSEILKGRILVGHAIHNDLKILLLDHPRKSIRDTQKYKPFKKIAKSGRPALRVLCREVLHVKVQQGEHSSVQDAQATMRLYTMVKKEWEAEIKAKNHQDHTKKPPRKPKVPRST